jgi:hypothetical protein
MATSFAMVLTLVYLSLNTPDNLTHRQQMNLPEWVMDTEVPLTLIEDLEFYDWLAQHPEYLFQNQTRNQTQNLSIQLHPMYPRKDQTTYDEKAFTLAVNEFNQFRYSERLTTEYIAKGLSGTTDNSGEIQR